MRSVDVLVEQMVDLLVVYLVVQSAEKLVVELAGLLVVELVDHSAETLVVWKVAKWVTH